MRPAPALALVALVLACAPEAPSTATTAELRLPATGGQLPAVTIVSPPDGTYFRTKKPDPLHPDPADNPGHPLVEVSVTYQVSNWVYPALNKGVAFFLDGVGDPAFSSQVLTIAESWPGNPLVLTGLPPGQHTLTACLVQKVQKTVDGVAGLYWDFVDVEFSVPDVQRACDAVVVKVAIVGCWPTVYDPQAQAYVCDPAHPGACCLDQNPCSTDTCQWQEGPGQFECRYEPAAEACCRFDAECASPARCYLADNPDTELDSLLLNRCVACDPTEAGADALCDDADACTADTCTDAYACAHAPIVGPLGEPCCTPAAALALRSLGEGGCADDDPCTIDRCEDLVDGHGVCRQHPYVDLTAEQITGYGYDPAAFEGCCVVGKESLYCTDHLVLLDGVLQQDACWAADCLLNQCHYGQSPDPLCCNAAAECEDCADYDPDTGACLEPNACTLDLCVDHHCEYDYDPFHPVEADCCVHDADCDDQDPSTVDACIQALCVHVIDPFYCDPNADPPVLCEPAENPCYAVECDLESSRCHYFVPVLACEWVCPPEGDDWCLDGLYPANGPFPHCNELPVIPPLGFTTCCHTSADCFDGKVCTTGACLYDRCVYGAFAVDVGACPSGRCCESDTDLDGDGGADDCTSGDACAPQRCVDHCCVPVADLAPGACHTAEDCRDGDASTWNACDGCECVLIQAPPDCATNADCDDGNPCTHDVCDATNRCGWWELDPACCVAAADCVPAEPLPCTTYTCDHATHACASVTAPDCCQGDDDPLCDDQDACTADSCLVGACVHDTIASDCCTADAGPVLRSLGEGGCDDADPCTLDACVDGHCQATPIEGCPAVDATPEQAEPTEPEVTEPLPEPVAEPNDTAEPAPDVAEPAPEPPPEVIDANPADLGASTCPASAPEGPCQGDAVCAYGEACCCGACGPTVRCACFQGAWVCVDTRACVGSECDDVTTVDSHQPDGGHDDLASTDGGGSGCAWPGAHPSTAGLLALLLALSLLVRVRARRL